jgi:hypothetical protein
MSKITSRSYIVAAMLLWLPWIMPVKGAVTYTYNDTTDYTASDLVTSPAASATLNYFLRNNATNGTPTTDRSALQTFTVPAAFDLAAITLLVNRVAQNSSTEFRLIDFGTTNPNGSSITTATITAATLLASHTHTQSAAYGADALSALTWALDSSVTLSASRYYGLVVTGKNASNNALVWHRANNDPYAGGRAYLNPAQNTSYTTSDFGTGGSGALGNDWAMGLVAVIPEPASLALLGAGALLMAARRRV